MRDEFRREDEVRIDPCENEINIQDNWTLADVSRLGMSDQNEVMV